MVLDGKVRVTDEPSKLCLSHIGGKFRKYLTQLRLRNSMCQSESENMQKNNPKVPSNFVVDTARCVCNMNKCINLNPSSNKCFVL